MSTETINTIGADRPNLHSPAFAFDGHRDASRPHLAP